MSGRIVLLSTSPRVAPGMLSWPAWEVLRAPGSRVYAGDRAHPQLPALRDANVPVRFAGDAAQAAVAELLLAEATARVGERSEAGAGSLRDGVDQGGLDRAGRPETVVVWLSAPDGDPGLGEALASRLVALDDPPELELLAAAYDLPGSSLIDLVHVMDRLRRECPWVQGQTHRSLVRYLVEEAYETVEALESGDRTHLREELGDLLFQVVFHARLAEEYPRVGGEHVGDEDLVDDDAPAGAASGPWSIDNVAAELAEKLIRRNPHVFGGQDGAWSAAGTLTPDEIENVWDQLKSEEKRRGSVFEGLPPGLPALALADKVLQRAEQAGLELPDVPDTDVGRSAGDRTSGDYIDEEGAGGDQTEREGAAQVSAAAVGDRLLAVVRQARRAGIDPEQAIRDALRRRLPRRL